MPFLLLYPLVRVPRSEPNPSTPEGITGQGHAVTVTARPPGERGWAAPGSSGVWRGLAVVVVVVVMLGPARFCVPNPRGPESKGLQAGEAQPAELRKLGAT